MEASILGVSFLKLLQGDYTQYVPVYMNIPRQELSNCDETLYVQLE